MHRTADAQRYARPSVASFRDSRRDFEHEESKRIAHIPSVEESKYRPRWGDFGPFTR